MCLQPPVCIPPIYSRISCPESDCQPQVCLHFPWGPGQVFIMQTELPNALHQIQALICLDKSRTQVTDGFPAETNAINHLFGTEHKFLMETMCQLEVRSGPSPVHKSPLNQTWLTVLDSVLWFGNRISTIRRDSYVEKRKGTVFLLSWILGQSWESS